MGSNTFVFENIEILFSKYLYLTFRNEKYLYLNTFLKYLTFSAGVPMALAVTTKFVCSEPKDGLAPDSDHRSISPLFFSQAPSWDEAILLSWLTLKLSCHTSSQDPSSRQQCLF